MAAQSGVPSARLVTRGDDDVVASIDRVDQRRDVGRVLRVVAIHADDHVARRAGPDAILDAVADGLAESSVDSMPNHLDRVAGLQTIHVGGGLVGAAVVYQDHAEFQRSGREGPEYLGNQNGDGVLFVVCGQQDE